MKHNRPKFRNSIAFSFLLHLLVPGFGHVYRREYLFGLFVFLVTLMAAALFILSLFIRIPLLASLFIYGLPAVFYVFSFMDLARTVRSRPRERPPTKRRAVVFVLTGILYQAASPLAVGQFTWQNFPDIFVAESNDLAPVFQRGDVLKASSLAYMLKTVFVDQPIVHSLPERFAVVRFETGENERLNGIVLGLPYEDVEIVGGVIVIDGTPKIQPPRTADLVRGDWPLTQVDSYSILVATTHLGSLDRVYQVPLGLLVGKVEKLL